MGRVSLENRSYRRRKEYDGMKLIFHIKKGQKSFGTSVQALCGRELRKRV
jgi:hypothetical protein